MASYSLNKITNAPPTRRAHCAAAVASHGFSMHGIVSRIVERIRRARDRRRQRQELVDYLASDHRAARDLGITSHEARNFSR
jgi:hypothetical protein